MNTERVKQIEMENILAQGDVQNLINAKRKRIDSNDKHLNEFKEGLQAIVQRVK